MVTAVAGADGAGGLACSPTLDGDVLGSESAGGSSNHSLSENGSMLVNAGTCPRATTNYRRAVPGRYFGDRINIAWWEALSRYQLRVLYQVSHALCLSGSSS